MRGGTAQSRGCVHGTPLSSGCCLQQLLRHQHTCFTMARSCCLHAPLHWPAGGGRHLEVDDHEEDGHRGQQLDDVGQALAVEGVLHCEGSGQGGDGQVICGLGETSAPPVVDNPAGRLCRPGRPSATPIPAPRLALRALVLSVRVSRKWTSAMTAPSNSGPRPTFRV